MDEAQQQTHDEIAEKLRSEENFVAALIAGAVATLLALSRSKRLSIGMARLGQ